MAATTKLYLEGRIHEARVAQIAEPAQTGLRLGLSVAVGGTVGTVLPKPAKRTHCYKKVLHDPAHSILFFF